MRLRLLRAAIILFFTLPLLAPSCGGGGDEAARASKSFAQILANTAEQADTGAAARSAGVGLPETRQVKTELQSGSSGLIGRLDQAVGTFSEEEYKAALDAACLANDTVAFVRAEDDNERRKILRSQGKTTEARMTATLSLAEELLTMKNGTDAEKAAASLICLGVNLKYG